MNSSVLRESHKTDWEGLASLGPMWAILSDRDKRGNKWTLWRRFNRATAPRRCVATDIILKPGNYPPATFP